MKVKSKIILNVLLAIIAALTTAKTVAQPLTLSGTNYAQNFDDMSVSGLPGEWVLYTGASSTALGTVVTAFRAGPTNGWSDSAGAFKNFASSYSYEGGTNFVGTESFSIQTNASNRALGLRSTGAFGDPGAAFTLKLADTLGFGHFKLDVDMLLLSVQGRRQDWTVDFGVSPDGFSLPTSFTVVSNNFFTASNTADGGVFGATHATIDFGTLLDNQPGPIWIRIAALSGSTGSGSRPSVGIDNFNLGFTNVEVVVNPPLITTPPQSQTAYVGDNLTLTVANSGTAPFTYQWYKDDFNTPVGNGTSSLLIAPVSAGDAGNYYVVIGNSAGSVTNDPPAAINVETRVPISTTILALRTNQDLVNWTPNDTTNLYTVTGVVISRANMTTAANASFFIEDTNTLAAIDVFIAGDTTTRPAYGDIMQVTGPVGQFNGVLELNLNSANPTHSVANLGPSGLEVAPKLFDFAYLNDAPLMETNFEASLVTVQNVTINNGGTGTNFPSGATVTITNQANQTFVLFIDSRLSDIAGQPIPGGLVNVTGYISQFDSSAPFTSGYQLVPTYAGAIVSAPPAPTPVALNIAVAGDQAIVTWDDATGLFKLASGTDVTGITNVVATSSPYTNTISGAAAYFRLVYP
jgi:hypothetical protein